MFGMVCVVKFCDRGCYDLGVGGVVFVVVIFVVCLFGWVLFRFGFFVFVFVCLMRRFFVNDECLSGLWFFCVFVLYVWCLLFLVSVFLERDGEGVWMVVLLDGGFFILCIRSLIFEWFI